MKKALWHARPWQAFKTFALLFSFTMNLVLLLFILLAAPVIIPLTHGVARPLAAGLDQSLGQMATASIARTVAVNDQIPVAFTLPLSTTTMVTTTAAVPLEVPARFSLPGGGGVIQGTVRLQLPPGTALPVALNLQVPVDQHIPISLTVSVDIPVQETALGQPVNDLRALFTPMSRFLSSLPASNRDLLDRLRHPPRPANAPFPPQASGQ